MPEVENYLTGKLAREAVRSRVWRGPTAGLAPGYVQANLAILPEQVAFDFLKFCVLNPKACPVLDVCETGSPFPSSTWAENADLRVDLPGYRVYQDGELTGSPDTLASLWRDDFVSFLIGCSFTFEEALLAGGVPVRHIECGCNVPMYRTNIECRPAGIFHGPVVVSMRPIPAALVPRAVEITARYPNVHGGPIHIGHPQGIGIRDLQQPDFGDAVPVREGEIPVFWACGVTPQAVALAAKVPLMITHAPGHMLVTDRRNGEMAAA